MLSSQFFYILSFKRPLIIILFTKTLFTYYHSSKKIKMLAKLCKMSTALFVANYFRITFL